MRTIFIGNGINRLTEGYSWESLLNDLEEKFLGSETIKYKDNKPFTLLFEELSFLSRSRKKANEMKMKNRIADLSKNIKLNSYHTNIMKLNFNNIITTNYDYNFENSTTYNWQSENNPKETRYSLFRKKTYNNKNVWHIHGEIDKPKTIALGYEQYAGLLQRTRSHLTDGNTYKGFNHAVKSIFTFKKVYDFENSNDVFSWIDIFIRDDIHILGYSLDFSEIDLWWLIIYKEKLRTVTISKITETKRLPIGKTLYYFFYKEDSEYKIYLPKLSLLKSFGIEVIEKKVNNYKNGYDTFIENWNS